MYDITLICTHHSELGNCNSSELYKAIYWVRPEVIFEELSPAHHKIAYRMNEPASLEIKAVREYSKSQNVIQVPVDTYPVPKEYFEDLDKLIKATECNTFPESEVIRNLIQNQKALVVNSGLRFLNSNENEEFILQIDSLKEKILNTINDDNLIRIYKLEMNTRREREYHIIQNIYSYAKEYAFHKAIMLIGSGHRKSIRKLINEFQQQAQLKLNWKIY